MEFSLSTRWTEKTNSTRLPGVESRAREPKRRYGPGAIASFGFDVIAVTEEEEDASSSCLLPDATSLCDLDSRGRLSSSEGDMLMVGAEVLTH